MTIQEERKPKQRNSIEVVHSALDYALANPTASVNKISETFSLGIGTFRNWLVPQKSIRSSIHPAVKEWMEVHGTDWLEKRPRNKLGLQLMELITGNLQITVAEEKKDTLIVTEVSSLWDIVSEETSGWKFKASPLITPQEPVFSPKTTDDLMVLEHEVQHMLDRAESTVCQLKTVLTSIQVIRQWDSDKAARSKAESKIAELENQVRLADANVKKVQEEALSAKLIEKFGKK